MGLRKGIQQKNLPQFKRMHTVSNMKWYCWLYEAKVVLYKLYIVLNGAQTISYIPRHLIYCFFSFLRFKTMRFWCLPLHISILSFPTDRGNRRGADIEQRGADRPEEYCTRMSIVKKPSSLLPWCTTDYLFKPKISLLSISTRPPILLACSENEMREQLSSSPWTERMTLPHFVPLYFIWCLPFRTKKRLGPVCC